MPPETIVLKLQAETDLNGCVRSMRNSVEEPLQVQCTSEWDLKLNTCDMGTLHCLTNIRKPDDAIC